MIVGYDSGYILIFEQRNNIWKKVLSIKDNSAIISISTISYQNKEYIFTNNNASNIKYYVYSDRDMKMKEEFSFPLNKII